MNPRINSEVSQGAGSPERSTGLGKGQQGKRHCWRKSQEQPDPVSGQFTRLLRAQVGSSEMCVCTRSAQMRTPWAVRVGPSLKREEAGGVCGLSISTTCPGGHTDTHVCVCLGQTRSSALMGTCPGSVPKGLGAVSVFTVSIPST